VSGCSVPNQGSLEGTVTEFGTGNPIEGAVVTVGTGLIGTTLADGTYEITAIWPGDYNITCEAPLYLPAEELGFTIAEGVNTLDFSLLWSEIAVDVTELNSYLPPDTTEIQTFTITNDGPGDLEYNISFEYPAEISVRRVSNTQKVQNSRTTSNVTNSPVVKKTNNSVRDVSPFVAQPPVELIRDMWDLQFSFDATAASGAPGNAGVEFDGTYFYSTRWAASLIHKYDINGILVSEFSIPGVTGLRDLAYDGTHFYGGNAGNTIYEMDFDTQTLIGTISSSVGVRAIAYDSDLDAFYVTNWADPIGLIARDGTTISTFNCGLAGTYGFAYDNVTGGPYLWIYDQGAGAGTPQLIHQFDLTTNTLTGVSHSTTLELPDPSGIAGGLFLTTDYVSGIVTIGGLQQGVPDMIFCYELAPYSTWVAVTNNISATVPGNGGSIVVEVTFDSAELLIGDVLTADLLIHNNSNYTATRGDDYVIPVTLTVTGFIPPSNLFVDEATGLFTWDAPPGPDLLGYNVFLDDMINEIGTTTSTEWQYEDLVINQDYIAGVSAVYDDGESIVMEYPFTFQPDDAGDIIPLVTKLRGNFPNPFNPDTQIAFSLNKQSHVQITIYNIRGQLVRTLVDEQRDANNYTVTWDGTDDNRKPVSSGIYFYKMKAEKYTATKKMILMK
ncbi:MAG: T9SS type A sorting domain-containing protein, partial [Candidatus Cloacimonetes bacterium]|nr:T9SS type A sorting domain-containing protein [Candidatus Cloacimonadota bacterium]